MDWWGVGGFEVGWARVLGVEFGMGFEEADAAVPAEDAVVIADGADFFSFGKILEGFLDEGKKNVRGAAGAELGFGSALEEEAGVVEAFVGVGKFLEGFFRFAVAIGNAAHKLIRNGEAE